MKLFTKTQNVSRAEITPDSSGTVTSYDVPNTTIAGGAIILALIQALGTILGSYIGNIQKQESDKFLNKLKGENFKVQLLQRVLESEDTITRLNSIKLLIAADILNDRENKINKFIEKGSNIPKWSKRSLESLTGSFETIPSKPTSNPIIVDSPKKSP